MKPIIILTQGKDIEAAFSSEKALHQWMSINGYTYDAPGKLLPQDEFEAAYNTIKSKKGIKLNIHKSIPVYSSNDEEEMRKDYLIRRKNAHRG